MLMASANPEDYTNRGRIITPLKDRFGSQIRTHYPARRRTPRLAIMLPGGGLRSTSSPPDGPDQASTVPEYLDRGRRDLLVTWRVRATTSISVQRRQRPPQRGVTTKPSRPTRCGVGLRSGETSALVARVDDLGALAASSMGKIEIESIEDGREGAIMEKPHQGCRPHRLQGHRGAPRAHPRGRRRVRGGRGRPHRRGE